MKNDKSASGLSIKELVDHPELWASGDIPCLPAAEGKILLARYLNLLTKWNRSINLCGAESPLHILHNFIQDSFFLASFLDSFPNSPEKPVTWDLGAGAGLPGIPLRIIWNKGRYTWVEIRQKRALFLQTVQAELKLAAFNGYYGSVEKFFGLQQGQTADFIISRAFCPWKDLLELCKHVLSPVTHIIIMASSPPPALSPEWNLKAVRQYHIDSKSRFLWAITPVELSA